MFTTVFDGIRQNFVLVADTEFSAMTLIQASFLLFKRVKGNNYQLIGSFNGIANDVGIDIYCKKRTALTEEITTKYGCSTHQLAKNVARFLEGVPLGSCLFVSHGTKNDRNVLKAANIPLPEHSFCTYKNAMRILKKEKGNTLQELAEQFGCVSSSEKHDAYTDVWQTMVLFSALTNTKR